MRQSDQGWAPAELPEAYDVVGGTTLSVGDVTELVSKVRNVAPLSPEGLFLSICSFSRAVLTPPWLGPARPSLGEDAPRPLSIGAPLQLIIVPVSSFSDGLERCPAPRVKKATLRSRAARWPAVGDPTHAGHLEPLRGSGGGQEGVRRGSP
eukprot:1176181-Prorocentrum_minimum.AAC.3